MVYFNPRWPIVYHLFQRGRLNVRRKRKNEIEILPKNEFWSLRPAFDKNDETNKSCKERFPQKCEYIITKNVLKSNLESDPKPCYLICQKLIPCTFSHLIEGIDYRPNDTRV